MNSNLVLEIKLVPSHELKIEISQSDKPEP